MRYDCPFDGEINAREVADANARRIFFMGALVVQKKFRPGRSPSFAMKPGHAVALVLGFFGNPITKLSMPAVGLAICRNAVSKSAGLQ